MAKLEFLDHVAIRVRDPEKSAVWYAQVLGLNRFQPDEWKPVPIMMQAGNSGIALFNDPDNTVTPEMKEVMHIAFRLPAGQLADFVQSLRNQNVDHYEEDHIYFKSVYFRDPDNYRIEVTMPVE